MSVLQSGSFFENNFGRLKAFTFPRDSFSLVEVELTHLTCRSSPRRLVGTQSRAGVRRCGGAARAPLAQGVPLPSLGFQSRSWVGPQAPCASPRSCRAKQGTSAAVCLLLAPRATTAPSRRGSPARDTSSRPCGVQACVHARLLADGTSIRPPQPPRGVRGRGEGGKTGVSWVWLPPVL